jgi:hypothetical protein
VSEEDVVYEAQKRLTEAMSQVLLTEEEYFIDEDFVDKLVVAALNSIHQLLTTNPAPSSKNLGVTVMTERASLSKKSKPRNI